jgi:ABC-type antimicrobial peptide transport system permease subunit
MLLTLFAGAALLLAAIGIYGVLSYTVAQRTGEIGIRMALGANGGQLVRQIVGQGLGVALIGIALGVPAAFGASRLLARALEGVKTVDPVVVFVVTGTLLLVSTLAAWAPARRASRVSPMVALRAE